MTRLGSTLPWLEAAQDAGKEFAKSLAESQATRVELPFGPEERATSFAVKETLRLAQLNAPAGWTIRLEETPRDPKEIKDLRDAARGEVRISTPRPIRFTVDRSAEVNDMATKLVAERKSP
jgi:hypothetical protein